MLNGIDPILIFQIYKIVDKEITVLKGGVPVQSKIKDRVTTAVVPIYLSEKLTGIMIDSESKNIDINTDINTLVTGDPALVAQNALASILSVSLVASRDSVGLTILLAFTEMILDKVTSGEYEVTYMHGSQTVFGGLIHSFSVEQSSSDDLYKIKMDISRGKKKAQTPEVQRDPNAVPIPSQGPVPVAGAEKFSSTRPVVTQQQSVISPRMR